jgi:hypothetical protein
MSNLGGRPHKHTPEKLAAILEAISDRIPYSLAAESNGVSERAFYEWLAQGQEDKSNEIDSDLAKFAQAVKDIERKKIKNHLKKLNRNIKNWQADAWILERRWYKYFGANVHMQEMDERLKRMEALIESQSRGNGNGKEET